MNPPYLNTTTIRISQNICRPTCEGQWTMGSKSHQDRPPPWPWTGITGYSQRHVTSQLPDTHHRASTIPRCITRETILHGPVLTIQIRLRKIPEAHCAQTLDPSQHWRLEPSTPPLHATSHPGQPWASHKLLACMESSLCRPRCRHARSNHMWALWVCRSPPNLRAVPLHTHAYQCSCAPLHRPTSSMVSMLSSDSHSNATMRGEKESLVIAHVDHAFPYITPRRGGGDLVVQLWVFSTN